MINLKTIATATVISTLPAIASAAVLDAFDDFLRVQDAPNSSYPATDSDNGGDRAFAIDGTPDPETRQEGVVKLVSDGVLSFSNDANFSSLATIDYLLGGADLASLGDRFLIDFFGTDRAFQFAITASDGTTTDTIARTLDTDAFQTLTFKFSDFDGALDFSNVSSLRLTFDSVATSNFKVDAEFDDLRVEAVPVPAAGLLLLGGLGALGAIRRRKS